jgi:hypothetical protein
MASRHSSRVAGSASTSSRSPFAKLKALLRKAGARTREALLEAMGEALDAVTASDVRRFFEHRGYRAMAQLR